jgi:hypothetical protein
VSTAKTLPAAVTQQIAGKLRGSPGRLKSHFNRKVKQFPFHPPLKARHARFASIASQFEVEEKTLKFREACMTLHFLKLAI